MYPTYLIAYSIYYFSVIICYSISFSTRANSMDAAVWLAEVIVFGYQEGHTCAYNGGLVKVYVLDDIGVVLITTVTRHHVHGNTCINS